MTILWCLICYALCHFTTCQMIMNVSLIVFLVCSLFWTKSQCNFCSFLFCRLCEQMANLGVGSRTREGVDCVFRVMRKGDERELAFHHKLKTWKINLGVNQYNRSTKLTCTVCKRSMVLHKERALKGKTNSFIPHCTARTCLFKESLILI